MGGSKTKKAEPISYIKKCNLSTPLGPSLMPLHQWLIFLVDFIEIRCNGFPYRKYFQLALHFLHFGITSCVRYTLYDSIYSASLRQFCHLRSIKVLFTTTAYVFFIHKNLRKTKNCRESLWLLSSTELSRLNSLGSARIEL